MRIKLKSEIRNLFKRCQSHRIKESDVENRRLTVLVLGLHYYPLIDLVRVVLLTPLD